MLDREDDAALAEIEAALRRDDPAFVLLIERLEHDPLGVPGTSRITETRSTASDADPGELPGPSRPSGQSRGSADRPPSSQLRRRFDDPLEPDRSPDMPLPQTSSRTPGFPMDLLAPKARSRRTKVRQWLLLLLATAAAMAFTVAVSVLAGPDVGGLAGVVSITATTFVGYRRMTGCPMRQSRY